MRPGVSLLPISPLFVSPFPTIGLGLGLGFRVRVKVMGNRNGEVDPRPGV